MDARLFTPESARLAAERLRPTIESMRRAFRIMETVRVDRVRGDQPVDPEYFRLLLTLRGAISRIGRAGVEVRCARTGVLGFPVIRDGRRVVLCWRPDGSLLEREGGRAAPDGSDRDGDRRG